MTDDIQTSETCAECGTALARGGRPAKDGRPRYCMRQACQIVKQRRYRQSLRAADTNLAVLRERRPCSGCGDEMEDRPGRITDSELGRWCHKRGCRKDKRVKIAIAQRLSDGTSDSADALTLNELFWNASRLRRHSCWECGCPDGIVGFPHPTIDGQPCKALGGMKVSERDVRDAWPDRFPPA